MKQEVLGLVKGRSTTQTHLSVHAHENNIPIYYVFEKYQNDLKIFFNTDTFLGYLPHFKKKKTSSGYEKEKNAVKGSKIITGNYRQIKESVLQLIRG